MPRSSLAVLVLAIAGCAVEKRPVYVDVGLAVAADNTLLPAIAQVEKRAPGPFPGAVGSLPALRERVFAFPEVSRVLAAARADLLKSGERAFAAMKRSLEKVYAVQASIEADDYRKSRAREADTAVADALARLEATFNEYAAKRGEPLSRLAFLETQDPRLPGVVAEKESLRTQIGALDDKFDGDAAAILAGLRSLQQGERQKVDEEAARILRRFQGQAEREARRFTQGVALEIRSALASRAPMRLPAIPGATVRTPAGPPLIGVPDIGAIPADTGREQRVRHDLGVWLALNSYELAPARDGVSDVTSEFIAWRTSIQAGR